MGRRQGVHVGVLLPLLAVLELAVAAKSTPMMPMPTMVLPAEETHDTHTATMGMSPEERQAGAGNQTRVHEHDVAPDDGAQPPQRPQPRAGRGGRTPWVSPARREERGTHVLLMLSMPLAEVNAGDVADRLPLSAESEQGRDSRRSRSAIRGHGGRGRTVPHASVNVDVDEGRDGTHSEQSREA